MSATVIDSRHAITGWNLPVYVSSESASQDEWGQPPASHYVFVVRNSLIVGHPISGFYIPTSAVDSPPIMDQELLSEFADWESASDEDFSLFEEGLQE